jgi:hypothetical protein
MSAPSTTAQNTMTGGGGSGGSGAENLAKRTRKASQRTFTKKDF